MSGFRLTVPISQNAKFSFRRIAAFNDGRFHNPVNSAENSFSNHTCVCRLEIVALQNQKKVLQRSNYRVSGQYEAEFWLSNKRFCKQKEKKEGKNNLFLSFCVCDTFGNRAILI